MRKEYNGFPESNLKVFFQQREDHELLLPIKVNRDENVEIEME